MVAGSTVYVPASFTLYTYVISFVSPTSKFVIFCSKLSSFTCVHFPSFLFVGAFTTTFRAFAKPALVAVTETVTFSPWTNALEETVCLEKKNLRKRRLIKGKKSYRHLSFPRRRVQRRKRFVVYVVVVGTIRSRGNDERTNGRSQTQSQNRT